MSDIKITPYDQSGLVKNKNIFKLDYTNQDFWSMKTRLVEFINERFGEEGTELPGTFNDFVESSIAIMLMENMAFLADTLSFKIDQVANEIFIDTVTEVENAFRLSKLLGFNPLPPIASRSLWSATLNTPLSVDLVIPTPVVISTVSEDTPIQIELFPADSNNTPMLDKDIIIPAGSTAVSSIVGLEGRTTVDEFIGTGGISQTFELVNPSVIYDSIRVEVNGSLWERVEYFTDSQPRKEFRVEFDSNYNAFVIFGNNRAGLIPSQGSVIRITYRRGGGTVGNIVTGSVEVQRQFTVGGLDFRIPVNFRNYSRGEFGYNGDTIEDIRRKLPKWIKTQNRAVTGDDYKTLSDQFATQFHGKIGKSTAVLRNHGCAGNIIDLYVLASDGENDLKIASNQLKVELNEEINTKKMITDYVCVKNGSVILTDVSIDLTLDKFYKKFEPEIKANVIQKVNSFFNLNNWEFGDILKESNLIKELSEIKEVNNIDINFITNDPENSGNIVTTNFYEIIRPDQINVDFIYN